MAHWYTADPHFGHESIIANARRSFRDSSYMDAVLIERLWERVRPQDDLWVIGDFAFEDPAASKPLTLCHCPMMTWNHARKGALHLFGHIHGNWNGSANSINAGVDAWDFYPISATEAARAAKALPHHKHWKDVEPRA